MKVFFILLLFSSFVSAQTDWQRWEKKDPEYLSENDNTSNSISDSNSLADYSQKFYKFFISDLDGDNCSFYPSCSKFWVTGVKKTNVLQGTLMFADRFTRDLNLFKEFSGYSYYYNGKFYDPAENHMLHCSKITFSKSYYISN